MSKYRVTIEQLEAGDDEYRSACRVNENAAYAICESMKGSGAITPRAMLIGIVSWLLLDTDLPDEERHMLFKWLRSEETLIPYNMRDAVSLATDREFPK